MKFINLPIKDAFLINPVIYRDERGNFNRSFCQKEFKKYGLENNIAQGNISENPIENTLRGFHYQRKPYQESKTITCITGEIFNVIIDLRKGSPSFLKNVCLSISSVSKESIYIPEGCANAWITLQENTIIHYYMGSFYRPGFDEGIRYDDPFFNINWPFKPKLISKKDLSYPDFNPEILN